MSRGMSKEKEKKKSCPFCGEEAVLFPDEAENPLYLIGCETPYCFMFKGGEGKFESESVAIEGWNIRDNQND